MNRTDKIYDIGTLPELGTIPYQMHAWVIREETLGEPIRSFHEEIVEVPTIGRDQVLVANMSAGVNYNGVWAARGKPKNVIARNDFYGDEKRDFHICGSESSGIVYAVGEDVTNVKVGDKVTIGATQYDKNCPVVKSGADPSFSPTFRVWGYESNWGAFAQFSRVYDYQCAPIPDNLNWSEASAFTACGVPVYRMLTHWKGNELKPGDVVLIYGGTGGIGSAAIKLTKYLGGIPVAVVSSEEKGKICMQLGAKGYINRKSFTHWGHMGEKYLEPEFQKKWLYQAMKFKKAIWNIVGERKSPAIVIEHPGQDTFPTSLFVCDTDGMVVTCGATSSYLAEIDLRYLWLNQKRIQGTHSGTREDYEAYVKAVVDGNLKPLISKTFEWNELAQAHQLLYEGKGSYGRMTINIGLRSI